MSHLLWKYYWEDDVDRFRRLLHPSSSTSVGGGGGGLAVALGTSPRAGPGTPGGGGSSSVKGGRKTSGPHLFHNKNAGGTLSKADVNSRDHVGLTPLLRAVSSTAPSGLDFVRALLEHPAVDIHAQDPESGWNALHRALYAGNVSAARLLLERERRDQSGSGRVVVGRLIKTKDHEGNSPFDLYNSTIGERALNGALDDERGEGGADDDASVTSEADQAGDVGAMDSGDLQTLIDGDELFTFGSNKNISLGLGDQDDRQYPERVYLKRPDHLIQRFYEEWLEESGLEGPTGPQKLQAIPALVHARPLEIHDVVLSKLHSAVLTTDPVSNLYVCGVGRGGRLGLGDENTMFKFTPVQGGLADRKVTKVALGQNHTMAVTDTGELWTWGSNTCSQLGYALPPPAKADEDPMSTTPRKVFGTIKNEYIIGAAASAIHSVAHTETSLYCWGKNAGQLALMDADSRSLEVQQTPRKVAASLFPCAIVMVTAIDKATTCLLANHTVCIFTAFGYNIVKFPMSDPFSNAQLSISSMSSRYDPVRGQIKYVASGGETIAAVSARGDLFTMHLNHSADANAPAASTTNPSKIKGAVTPPQCVWSARKDGVRSADVGEHGSVIISTQSGAVWRRVRRAKAKHSHVLVSASGGAAASKSKDYKFQRVPYITQVVAVRSSVFGAFAAVRRDAGVMRERIAVDEQTLWEDVAPLLPIADFVASEPGSKDKDTLKFWNADVLRERLGSVAYEVLKSPDLDKDLEQYLFNWRLGNDDLDTVVCTTTAPELRVPVHSWILSARSVVLRAAMVKARKDPSCELPSEVFSIDKQDGKTVITFQGIDLISLLNLVLYVYTDKVIPAWNYTRQAPPLAYRYRQIRTELMKTALRLEMPQLETAVRLQTEPKRSMDRDFDLACNDRRFFDDGDAVLELDGREVTVHSTFLCQRCPWFQGLFNGRSGGMWLAGRRETGDPSEKVKLDLSHMDPTAFRYVLRHLYADTGSQLFDAVVSPSFDDFTDLVMDVMSIANELMLDRLAQVCQQVLGRSATTSRNLAHLLNAIAPCAVAEFRDAGLEYACLQMETMLENHLLDELDDDLLLELDGAVRANQAAQMPFARSGRAEADLLERYPELAQDVDEERQVRVKALAYRARERDDERKLSSSFKAAAKFGSLDDSAGVLGSPSSDRMRRKSRAAANEPFSPSLRPKASHVDLMFDMDEEESSGLSSPRAETTPKLAAADSQPAPPGTPLDRLGSLAESTSKGKRTSGSPASISPLLRPVRAAATPSKLSAEASPASGRFGNPWGAAPPPIEKLDLKEILAESAPPSTPNRGSALSAGLASQRAQAVVVAAAAAAAATATATAAATPKLSQKERKKQQQLQQAAEEAAAAIAQAQVPWEKASGGARPAPWKAVPPVSAVASPRITVSESPRPIPSPGARAAEASSLPASRPIPRRAASPDTRFAGQRRGTTPTTTPSLSQQQKQKDKEREREKAPLVPHSKSYMASQRALAREREQQEQALLLSLSGGGGLSMADIIGQQKREQESVREAVAKRSLQEIQQEQAFQEWWDQESRKAREEEEEEEARRRAAAAAGGSAAGPGGGARGKVRDKEKEKGRGRKGGRGGGAAAAAAAAAATGGDGKAARGGGGGGGPRGGSRGGGGGGRNAERGRGGGGGGGHRAGRGGGHTQQGVQS